MLPRRNLLIALDAFGTLFQPRRPIAQQYGEVARSLGLTGFKDEDIEKEFRKGKFHSDEHNSIVSGMMLMLSVRLCLDSVQAREHTESQLRFEKADGGQIIESTFISLVGSDPKIGEELAPQLLRRFATEEGYSIFPDAVAFLKALPKNRLTAQGRIVVGIVTNSDDRVPDVLASLGLRVSPDRYGSDIAKSSTHDELYDIDFTVMSYDVGYEKPDGRIFKAAEDMLRKSHQAEDTDLSSWDMLYIGDDYDKDVVGALNAGWRAVWVNRGSRDEAREVEWLDDKLPGELEDIFSNSKVVGFSDLTRLSRWLTSSS
nr:putative uncharacterized hydrolase c7d4.05 [Quercus suber]